MDRDRLERYLAEGLSLEAIGTTGELHPSTVGYWMRRVRTDTEGRAKHARKGDGRRDDTQLTELTRPQRSLDPGRNRSERLSHEPVERQTYGFSAIGHQRTEARRRRHLALEARLEGQMRYLGRVSLHGQTTSSLSRMRKVVVPQVHLRGCPELSPQPQRDSWPRSRWQGADLRLRHYLGGSAVPSPRPDSRKSSESPRSGITRASREMSGRSEEVHPPLRELPRRGRSWGSDLPSYRIG